MKKDTQWLIVMQVMIFTLQLIISFTVLVWYMYIFNAWMYMYGCSPFKKQIESSTPIQLKKIPKCIDSCVMLPGVGPPLSLQHTRMLFALRINVLAKGHRYEIMCNWIVPEYVQIPETCRIGKGFRAHLPSPFSVLPLLLPLNPHVPSSPFPHPPPRLPHKPMATWSGLLPSSPPHRSGTQVGSGGH